MSSSVEKGLVNLYHQLNIFVEKIFLLKKSVAITEWAILRILIPYLQHLHEYT